MQLWRRGSEEFPAAVSGLLLVKTNDSRTSQTRTRIYTFIYIYMIPFWRPVSDCPDAKWRTLYCIYVYKVCVWSHGGGGKKGWWLSWTRSVMCVEVVQKHLQDMRVLLYVYHRNNNIILYYIILCIMGVNSHSLCELLSRALKQYYSAARPLQPALQRVYTIYVNIVWSIIFWLAITEFSVHFVLCVV